ncbi:GNAT family N-acetyltransferase [Ruania halotolerans]|uniref:GNAT family N-acetyltransferase n=1 Tax=Ruania halotolerans TaxID=2897773 RepID=UPI001E30B57A|nr:GNAT family N-acetyltransferase [Ruania halotolerans]UFU04809.1 GNAT family N-acetyltransferase [Ruania halotolerans]
MAHGNAPVGETTYPEHWEADVVLRDGTTMRIRPILPTDADAVERFHARQSPESVYLRFFAPLERLPARDLHHFTHVDHRTRVALVLESGGELVAIGRFDRVDEDSAEIAFNVSDSAQGRGLGSVLLEHLAAAGRELGVRRFVADVLPQNARMLRVFTDAGYDVHQVFDDGIVSVSFTIRPTDRSLAVLMERERRAEALSMRAVLAPRRVLLVGAGEEGTAFAERLRSGLGRVAAGRVVTAGLGPGAPRVEDLEPEAGAEIDLALVAAPAAQVLDLVPQLARVGVRAVVLYTGGYESGQPSGKVPQRTLVRTLRQYGMRLVGPRSFGVLTGGEAEALNATLWTGPVRAGRIGIFCQSAAAGLHLLDGAAERRLGLSSFLSAGHRVDVSGNDAMQYWTTDDQTTVACVRLESIGNPRKFSRVARRLSEKGPVVAMIAGTTGQLQLPGHSVRTTRVPRRALDELMRQAGVLQTQSVTEMLDLAALLSEQPLPAGDRVLVITNTGAQAAVLAELVRHHRLTLACDPIAMSPRAGAAEYAEQVDAALARDDWDVAVVGYAPLLAPETGPISAHIRRLAEVSGRTVAATLYAVTGLIGPAGPRGSAGEAGHEDAVESVEVPTFPSAETAVAAIAQARQYRRWRESGRGRRVDFDDVDRRGAKNLVQAELTGLPAGTTKRLPPERARQLLGSHGIRTWSERRVSTLEEALIAAEEVGWPVALKTVDELLRHRSYLGAIRLDLSTPAELTEAYRQAEARVRALTGRTASFDVQAMAPPGVACVIRAAEDPLYGPILSVGLAGDAVELLGDVSYRVPPLTDEDVSEMIRSLRASPRLFGQRGLPASDVAALEDVLGRVSVLKDELAEVSVVELNPVLVAESGVAILGMHVDVAQPQRGDAARRVLP